jgi:hypothetical protein
MIGQGRPSSSTLALARTALVLCAVLTDPVFGQLKLPPISAPVESAPVPPAVPAAPSVTPIAGPVTLQIKWGGGTPRQWTGRAAVDAGTLSDLKLLGTATDVAGSIWLDEGQLRIGALSPHRMDQIEVTAVGPSSAQLSIEFADRTATPVRAQLPISELVHHPHQMRLDDEGNTLEISVKPAPPLQITIQREAKANGSLVFAPGEQLSFELGLELPNALHGTTLDVQTTLAPARRKDSVWTDSQKLAVPVDGRDIKLNINVPLQQAEGEYTVRVVVSRPSGYFRDKFFTGATAALAERAFDIVLIDSRPRAQAAPGRWNQVLEIDPSNPSWMERLPSWTQLRRIPGLNLNHGPIGSVRVGAIDTPLGRFVELPPAIAGADPHWQAFSLPIESVGVPYLLEVDYPADKEQHFGLSIVEPNSNGVVEGVQRDSGVYVEGLGSREAAKKQTHQLLFWPRTQAAIGWSRPTSRARC